MLHGSQTLAQMGSRRCASLTRLTRLFSRKMVIFLHDFSHDHPGLRLQPTQNQAVLLHTTPSKHHPTTPPTTPKKNTSKSRPFLFRGQSQKEIFVNEIHVDTIDKHQNLSTSGGRFSHGKCVCWKSWCGGDILWDLDLICYSRPFVKQQGSREP